MLRKKKNTGWLGKGYLERQVEVGVGVNQVHQSLPLPLLVEHHLYRGVEHLILLLVVFLEMEL